METIKKQSPLAPIIPFAAAYKAKYIWSVILAIISVAAGLAPYFAVAKIVTYLIGGGKDLQFCFIWCGVALAGYILKVLMSGWSTSLSHQATFVTLRDIRRALVAKLSRLPMGKLIDTPSGSYKDIIVDRVESMETTLGHLLPEMTSNLLIPIFILVYLFFLDWRMALVSLITLPFGMACMTLIMRSYGEKCAQSIEIHQRMNNAVVEYVGGIEVIKAFNQSAASYAKYADTVKENADFFYGWMKSVQWPMSAFRIISPSTLLTVLPVGLWFFINGSLSSADFVLIIILSLSIVEPLIAASNFTDNISTVGTTAAQISSILEADELIRPGQTVELDGLTITLNHVSFSYHEETDERALSDVSLTIEPGTVTALVGPSGSGKSTIAKLIAGYWDVTDGAIMIGGVDVREIPQKQLADKIAYVAQDNYLFDDTIRENIRMSRRSATDAEVEKAAVDAGVDAFIRGLEHGYDTRVGGGGGHLSGGERQRIAIARAILKDAPAIILDEATAYIDPENEAALQQAIAKLVRGKTLIVIAHRLSTITDSNQIIVMKDGRITATGRHKKLLEQCNLYQEMWRAHIGAREGELS
ncbi:MAG: ABC transporter ATP-binding protein [Negativicutes bacterium]|nr:ABC transporter ATP-binding protein [Negativicutes bacterium]